MATNDAPLNVAASRGLSLALSQAHQAKGLIFEDSFDSHPFTDASSGITSSLAAKGWTDSRESDTHYTPADGFPNNHHLWEISDDPEHTRTTGGKGFVSYRESYVFSGGQPNFTSDGVLLAILPQDHNEIYAEFYMKFQPGFTPGGQTKLFRVGHYDREGGVFDFFSDGNTCPYYIWDYNESSFGARQVHAFRQDPQETNYFMTGFQGTPRSPQNGNLDMNFDDDMRDLDADGNDDNPITMTDLTTGTTLQPGAAFHEQIYGSGVWIKMMFHFKLNSAPGVNDGIIRFWMERGSDPGPQLVFENLLIPWMASGSPGNVGWNMIALGGNSNWGPYENADAVQEWIAFDDLKVYDTLPEGM